MYPAGPGAMFLKSLRADCSDDDNPTVRSHSAFVTLSVSGFSSEAIPNYHDGARAIARGRCKGLFSGQACFDLFNMNGSILSQTTYYSNRAKKTRANIYRTYTNVVRIRQLALWDIVKTNV